MNRTDTLKEFQKYMEDSLLKLKVALNRFKSLIKPTKFFRGLCNALQKM